jgi:hypothetical protein
LQDAREQEAIALRILEEERERWTLSFEEKSLKIEMLERELTNTVEALDAERSPYNAEGTDAGTGTDAGMGTRIGAGTGADRELEHEHRTRAQEHEHRTVPHTGIGMAETKVFSDVEVGRSFDRMMAAVHAQTPSQVPSQAPPKQYFSSASAPSSPEHGRYRNQSQSRNQGHIVSHSHDGYPGHSPHSHSHPHSSNNGHNSPHSLHSPHNHPSNAHTQSSNAHTHSSDGRHGQELGRRSREQLSAQREAEAGVVHRDGSHYNTGNGNNGNSNNNSNGSGNNGDSPWTDLMAQLHITQSQLHTAQHTAQAEQKSVGVAVGERDRAIVRADTAERQLAFALEENSLYKAGVENAEGKAGVPYGTGKDVKDVKEPC